MIIRPLSIENIRHQCASHQKHTQVVGGALYRQHQSCFDVISPIWRFSGIGDMLKKTINVSENQFNQNHNQKALRN